MIITNSLTEDIVVSVTEVLKAGIKISRPKFSDEEIGRCLATIYELNGMSHLSTQFEGVSINDWRIPEVFKGMLFPEITLSGADDEEVLVHWGNETKYLPFNEVEMMLFSQKLYGSFRADLKNSEIADIRKKRASILEYIPNLTLNKERVTQRFESGRFPIKSRDSYFVSYAEGASIKYAISQFVTSAFQSI